MIKAGVLVWLAHVLVFAGVCTAWIGDQRGPVPKEMPIFFIPIMLVLGAVVSAVILRLAKIQLPVVPRAVVLN